MQNRPGSSNTFREREQLCPEILGLGPSVASVSLGLATSRRVGLLCLGNILANVRSSAAFLPLRGGGLGAL